MNRNSLRFRLNRMSPEVRDEILAEGRQEEIMQHIEEKPEGYAVNIAENKIFPTRAEAEQEVKKIFSENPRFSNYSDLEK